VQAVRTEFVRDFVHGIRAHAHGHALVRAKRVDGHGKRRDDAVDGGFLKQQRLATSGQLHFTVGDLGDFEFGGDGLGNAFEFARLVERVDEIAEGIKSHTAAKLTDRFTRVKRGKIVPENAPKMLYQWLSRRGVQQKQTRHAGGAEIASGSENRARL